MNIIEIKNRIRGLLETQNENIDYEQIIDLLFKYCEKMELEIDALKSRTIVYK